MSKFCDVKKNDTKIDTFTTFSTFKVTYNLFIAIGKQTKTFKGKN